VKLLVILVCKSTCPPVSPLSKVRGDSSPVMHPHSDVTGYPTGSDAHAEVHYTHIIYCRNSLPDYDRELFKPSKDP